MEPSPPACIRLRSDRRPRKLRNRPSKKCTIQSFMGTQQTAVDLPDATCWPQLYLDCLCIHISYILSTTSTTCPLITSEVYIAHINCFTDVSFVMVQCSLTPSPSPQTLFTFSSHHSYMTFPSSWLPDLYPLFPKSP